MTSGTRFINHLISVISKHDITGPDATPATPDVTMGKLGHELGDSAGTSSTWKSDHGGSDVTKHYDSDSSNSATTPTEAWPYFPSRSLFVFFPA